MCIDVHSFKVLERIQILQIWRILDLLEVVVDISSFSIASPTGFAPHQSPTLMSIPVSEPDLFFGYFLSQSFFSVNYMDLVVASNGSYPPET